MKRSLVWGNLIYSNEDEHGHGHGHDEDSINSLQLLVNNIQLSI